MGMKPTEADHLFSPEVTAHCFFGRCAHVVSGTPRWVNEEMERHYESAHRTDIDHILGHWR